MRLIDSIWFRPTFVALFVLILLVCVEAPAHAARHALVIGNDSYAHISPLKNARADARAMAQALETAGFKVTTVLDQPRSGMNAALRRFKGQLAGGDEAVFFFAGHGVQLDGSNYLLPTDIRDEQIDQIRDDALNLQRVLDDLAAQKVRFSLAIVDACRDNPFTGAGRSVGGRGLAPTYPASGQMIIFSAGTGQQALDRVGRNDDSPNGLFTRVFVQEIAKPGLLAREALYNVRDEVVRLAKSVGHEQVPAIYDQSTGKFYFRRGTAVASAASSLSGGTEATAPLPNVSLPDPEADLWAAVRLGDTADDYAAYLAQYPAGPHAVEAKQRQALLQKQAAAATAQQDKAAWAKAQKLASAEGFRAYLDAWPQGTYRALAETRLKRLEANGGTPGQSFKDCADCPEMVNIPGGVFQMGRNGPSTEQPIHTVSVPAFALGRFEVTRGQWAAFVRDTGYKYADQCISLKSGKVEINQGGWLNPGFTQEDDHPATCMHWDDARIYVTWLARKTGKPYRLPSEAEWEYACRAGSAHDYCGSDDQRSVAWNGENSGGNTRSVGQKRANAFGLYDMSGNVWEWVQDCWNDSYAGAPTDGKAWISGNCEERTLRGGSWLDAPPNNPDAFFRAGYPRWTPVNINGFRVALSPTRPN